MTHVVGKLVWLLITPTNLLVLALGLGIAAIAVGRRRLGRVMVVTAALALVVAGFSPLAPWALATLEDRFPPTQPATVDGIIVLGGFVDPAIATERGAAAINDSAERLTELLVLLHRHPRARAVFTGGSGTSPPEPVGEAAVVEALLADLGVPPGRVAFERASRNSYENAVFTQRLMAPAPGETWLLVTSAFHMPRAIAVFRALGWDVVAHPVDYRATPADAWKPLSSETSVSRNLRWLDTAAKEVVGLIAYRLLGRSDALWPEP